MDLAKGISLVTGSSSGIGRAIAERLGRDGFYVLAHYHKNHEGAIATQKLVQEAGGRCEIVQFDVAKKEQVEDALNKFFKQPEMDMRLDVLVNNAGIASDNMLGMMSDNEFDKVIQTNVYGAFYLSRYCVKRMLRQKSGSIVNIASLAGQTGNAGQFNYAASKAALIGMTKSLAMEMGSRNIRVNAVSPGLIETEMIAEIPNLEEFKKRIPLGRFGTPREVAGVVSFLCSQDASYMSGATLSVNGGLFPV